MSLYLEFPLSSSDTSLDIHMDQANKHQRAKPDSGNGRCTTGDNNKRPNSGTLAAMAELEAGNGVAFDSIEDLMADLNAED